MANRNRNQNYRRDNEDRGNYGNRWSQSGRGGYGSDFDYERDDEGYFGGGRQMGEGNRTSDSINNYDNDDYGYNNTSQSKRNRNYERENNEDSLNDYGGGGTYGGYRQRRYTSTPPNFGSRRSEYYESHRSNRQNDERNEDERSWLDRAGDEVASWFGDKEAEHRRQQDIRGGHRGKGPKNYTRSDERIREEINDRLTDYDYLDASDIEVEVSGGEVTLTGNVDSRYAKRVAEDIAEEVSGVKNVENRLRVSQSSYTLGSSGTSMPNSATSSGMGMPDRVSGSTGMTQSSTETNVKSSKKSA